MIRNDVDGQLAVNANMARSANPAARLAGAAAMVLCRSRFYGYLSPCTNTEKSGIDHESGYRGRGYPGETGCLCFDPTRDCLGQLIYC